MKDRHAVLILFSLLMGCATLPPENFKGPTIAGNWEIACLRCTNPGSFKVIFQPDGKIQGNTGEFCKNLLPIALLPQTITGGPENCTLLWRRVDSENEISAKYERITLSYKVRQVSHKDSTFFEMIHQPEVQGSLLSVSAEKFELTFLAKQNK